MHNPLSLLSLSTAFLAAASLCLGAPHAPTTTAPACSQSVGISRTRASQVVKAFSKSSLASGVVAPTPINPTVDLEAVYADGKAVDLGNVFSTTETTQMPNITFTAEQDHDPSTTNYTLLIVDPDAPSPSLPLARFFLHLIIINARPTCVPATQQTATDFVPYFPFTPLSLALHRYVFLVYRQPSGVFVPQVQPAEVDRTMFNLTSFVEAGDLILVGGNFLKEGLKSTA